MERRVFTYKDVEEAKKYIGKKGVFSDDFREIHEGKGMAWILLDVDGYYPFVPDSKLPLRSNWPFFSPDPEPVETWVPFTAEDAALFAGKFIRDAVSWEDKLGSMIVAYHLKGAHIVAPGTGVIREIEYSELWARFVFLDGTPCGKKIKE